MAQVCGAPSVCASVGVMSPLSSLRGEVAVSSCSGWCSGSGCMLGMAERSCVGCACSAPVIGNLSACAAVCVVSPLASLRGKVAVSPCPGWVFEGGCMPGRNSCGTQVGVGCPGWVCVGSGSGRGAGGGGRCGSSIRQLSRSGVFALHRTLWGVCSVWVIQLAGSGVLLRQRLRLGVVPSSPPVWRVGVPGGRSCAVGSVLVPLYVPCSGVVVPCWAGAIRSHDASSVVLVWARFRPV